jgi:acyl-CoA synthetase (AMP-forming)/AMP-acid ligase II
VIELCGPLSWRNSARGAPLRAGGPEWIDVRELIAAADGMQLLLPARQTPDPTHEAVILFTSGSTGHPKAVSLSHLNVISGLMNMMLASALAALEDRDRVPTTAKLPPCALIHTPLCYIGGLSAVLMAIMNGTRVVVTDEWNCDAACALVEAEQVTALPHLGRTQIEELLSRDRVIQRLSSIGLHGASVPRKVIEQIVASAPAVKIVAGYGMTETSGSIAVISGHALRSRPGSSGRIVPALDVRICTANGSVAVAEEPGELLISGVSVMRGYLQSGRAFEVDCFNTGDIAHIAADGHFMWTTAAASR